MKVQNRHNEFLTHFNELYPRPAERYPVSQKRESERKTKRPVTRAKHICLLAIAAIAVTANIILPDGNWLTNDFAAASRASYTVEWRSYTVRYGDTLWDLAERFMGDGMGYHVIAYENKLANPDLIHPNDVLIIPVILRE